MTGDSPYMPAMCSEMVNPMTVRTPEGPSPDSRCVRCSGVMDMMPTIAACAAIIAATAASATGWEATTRAPLLHLPRLGAVVTAPPSRSSRVSRGSGRRATRRTDAPRIMPAAEMTNGPACAGSPSGSARSAPGRSCWDRGPPRS